ncbi:MAG: MATE family efflux transporter, partial [Oscillospiraceae bacterium]
AVGTAFPVTFMVTAVAFGLSNGAAVIVGQSFGSGKKERIKRIITICVWYAVAVSLLLSVICYLLSPFLLKIINASPEIYDDALTYLRVYFVGLIFTFTYNMISSIFRALGDSKTPLIFLGVASVVNIVLDLFFVLQFGWGVFGVAVATVIAQGLSFLLQAIFLGIRLKHFSELEKQGPELPEDYNKQVMKSLMTVAIPSTMQEFTIGINIFIAQALVNLFGADATGAYAACGKIENFAMMPMINASIAMTSYTAQNMGAGKSERVVTGRKYALGFTVAVAAMIGSLVVFFPRGLMMIFLGPNTPEAVFTIGEGYLRVMAITVIEMAFLFSTEGVLRGSGDVKCLIWFAVASMVTKVSVSVSLIYIFNMGINSVWIGSVCSWGIEMIMSLYRYRSGKWKSINMN